MTDPNKVVLATSCRYCSILKMHVAAGPWYSVAARDYSPS